MKRLPLLSLLVWGGFSLSTLGLEESRILFMASFEETTLAQGLDYDEDCSSGGYWSAGPAGFAEGVRGKAAEFGYEIVYPVRKSLDPRAGTAEFWVKITGASSDPENSFLLHLDKLVRIPEKEFTKLGLTDGRWHHLAVTWSDGKPGPAWVDGRMVGAGPTLTSGSTEAAAIRIGSFPEKVCLIDEFHIWDRKLSGPKIESLFQMQKEGRWDELKPPHPRSHRLYEWLGESRPKVPKPVDWSLEGVAQRQTSTRVAYCLNGYWRFLPFEDFRQIGKEELSEDLSQILSEKPGVTGKSPNWYWIRVNGCWKGSDANRIYDENFKVFQFGPPQPGQEERVASGVMWDPKAAIPYVVLEREVDLSQVKGYSRAVLRLEGYYGAGFDVYVNGKPMGAVTIPGDHALDITGVIKWDGPNRIGLLCRDSHGFDKDIWLELSQSRQVGIADLFVMTSTREKKLDLEVEMENLTGKALEVELITKVLDLKTGAEIKGFPAGKISLGAERLTTSRVSFSWPDPHLWCPEDPFLYLLSVTLQDTSGKVIDESYPLRFGFREFWIDKGRVWLNGSPIILSGYGQVGPFSDREGNRRPTEQLEKDVRTYARLLKSLGSNAAILRKACNDHVIPDVCDEEGIMLLGRQCGIAPARAGKAWPVIRRNVLMKGVIPWVKKFRNHPSIVIWITSESGGYGGAHFSNYAAWLDDEKFREVLAKDEKMRVALENCRDCKALYQSVDPTRTAVGWSTGLLDDIKTMFNYQGFGYELQSREDWPSQWSKTKERPILITEFGWPVSLNWISFHSIDSKTGQWVWMNETGTGDELSTEFAAIYFGDEAYRNVSGEYAEGVSRRYVERDKRSQQKLATHETMARSRNYAELKSLVLWQTARAWRTYGVNMLYHAELHGYFNWLEQPKFDRVLDVRAPGFRPDDGAKEWISYYSGKAEANKIGQTAKRVFWPILAFIGGREDHFTEKDHAFYSGERIRKQIIALNDYRAPVKASVSWQVISLPPQGQPMAQGKEDIVLPPGSDTRIPIEFVAPEVPSKQSCQIQLEVSAGDKAFSTRDAFDIRIYPKPKGVVWPRERVVLLDSVGETKKLLEEAGLEFEACSEKTNFEGARLLIIGRRSLTDSARELLGKLQLDAAVGKGLNVLIFEQIPEVIEPASQLALEPNQITRKDWSIAGLKADQRYSRNVFIRDPDSPIFKGLDNEDFSQWRGESALLPPYPEPPEELMTIQGSHSHPRRFPHWSNQGVVATCCVEKPHTGPFESLVDCEFDLMYSALLEARIGRGRILLCLLDVTERYRKDPVATLLTDRLLNCLLEPRKAEYRTKVKYLGADSGWKTLGLLQVKATREDSLEGLLESEVAVIGPDEKTISLLSGGKAKTKSFLEKGGNLLVLSLKKDAALDWLPFAVSLKEAEVFRTEVPAGASVFKGLGMADFWWRRITKLAVLEGLPEGAVKTDPAILASLPVGKGQVVFCQILPEMFHDPEIFMDNRQFVKTARVLNTLLTNLGAETPMADWSPLRKGYGKDLLPYLCRTLSFDPYEHHYW